MKKKNVLIVDDTPSVRRILHFFLQAEGFHVEEVSTGEEALAYCDYNLPDCIFLDRDMAVMDGFEFLDFFKYNHPNTSTKIIICSYVGDDHEQKEEEYSGADSFIQKPFQKEIVYEALSKLELI